jgi:hypothetical protein
MAVRIFHKDHGYVITADQEQIKALLAKGGVIDEKKEEIKPSLTIEETEIPAYVPKLKGKRK